MKHKASESASILDKPAIVGANDIQSASTEPQAFDGDRFPLALDKSLYPLYPLGKYDKVSFHSLFTGVSRLD